MVKEIYTNALQSKVKNNINVVFNDLINKTLEYRVWKSYYKKFKKYLANKVLDFNLAYKFALVLSCANIICSDSDKKEFEEIKGYLSEFISLLEGFKNCTDTKMIRIISCLDLNLVYNNIVLNNKNNDITRK